MFVLVLSAAVLVLLLDDLALRIEYEYEYRPEGLSTSTKVRDAKLFGRFTETDETSDLQYLVAASMADRIYSKLYSRVQKLSTVIMTCLVASVPVDTLVTTKSMTCSAEPSSSQVHW